LSRPKTGARVAMTKSGSPAIIFKVNTKNANKDTETAGKFSRPYLVFIIIFACVSITAIILIVKSGFAPERMIPAINPFYSEAVNYPPKGAGKVGAIAFLASALLYFLVDCFPGQRLKGWKKVLFVAASIILIISIVEISMDMYVKKYPPLHRPHPLYLWEVYPGREGMTDIGGEIRMIKVNRFGFRGDEISISKPPGTYRIMILGDSSAFGYGVHQDEVFAGVLQKNLREEYPDVNIQVINSSVPGYTTFSTLNFFREKGIKFDPDLIIISHNNDPDRDWDEDKNRASPAWLQPVLRILYRSNIYMTARREILNRKYGKTPDLYNVIPEGKGVHRVSADDFEKNLQGVFDLAKRGGTKVLVISMPRMEDDDSNLLLYRGIMKDITQKNGGVFLDLLQNWQEPDSEHLFIDDMHPNAEGHSRISREIAKEIEKAGWLIKKGK